MVKCNFIFELDASSPHIVVMMPSTFESGVFLGMDIER
jgi:hypothetical protein